MPADGYDCAKNPRIATTMTTTAVDASNTTRQFQRLFGSGEQQDEE